MLLKYYFLKFYLAFWLGKSTSVLIRIETLDFARARDAPTGAKL